MKTYYQKISNLLQIKKDRHELGFKKPLSPCCGKGEIFLFVKRARQWVIPFWGGPGGKCQTPDGGRNWGLAKIGPPPQKTSKAPQNPKKMDMSLVF